MIDYSSFTNREVFKNKHIENKRIFSYVTVNPRKLASLSRDHDLGLSKKNKKTSEKEPKSKYSTLNSSQFRYMSQESKLKEKKQESMGSMRVKLLWLNEKPTENDKKKEQKKLPERSSTPRYTQDELLKKIAEKKKSVIVSPPTIINDPLVFHTKNKVVHPKPTKLEVKTSRIVRKVDQITQTDPIENEPVCRKLRSDSKSEKKRPVIPSSNEMFRGFLKNIFVATDEDKDGFITTHDAENILIHLNERFGIPYNVNDVKAFFSRVITLFRGFFSFSEFCKAFNLD